MHRLADLLLSLVDGIPHSAGSADEGVALCMKHLVVDTPLEVQTRNGEFGTSLPRGRLRTGFDVGHGRLRAHFNTAAIDDVAPANPHISIPEEDGDEG